MVLRINYILQCFVDWVNVHFVVVHQAVVFGVWVLFEPNVEGALALVVVSGLIAWSPIRTHHSDLHVVLVVIYQQQRKSELLGLSKTPNI